MIPDAHTPCPACPAWVRDLYAAVRRVLLLHEGASPEYEDLHYFVEAARPFIEAHYADQRHAFAPELDEARQPHVLPPGARPAVSGVRRDVSLTGGAP